MPVSTVEIVGDTGPVARAKGDSGMGMETLATEEWPRG